MHETMLKTLKILYNTRMSKENLSHNLDIRELSINKNINLINEYLKELKFQQIEIKNGIIELNLTKRQWKILFNKINSLTLEEKIDYLYIKLIYYGFLNLEKEKDELSISRSSIDRCFLILKNLLEINNSKIIYINGKGNKLISLSEQSKVMFTVKLMKLILEEDILIPVQKNLLDNIKYFSIKMRIAKLVAIHKCLKLPITPLLLSFLCTLDIQPKTFENKKYNIDNKKYENISKVVNIIGNNFNEIYRNNLIYNIYSAAFDKNYYLKDLKNRANKILSKLLKIFKISCKNIEQVIYEQLYLSLMKKEYGILNTKNVRFFSEDKILLNILNNILDEMDEKLYICDKYIIIKHIKKEIILKNKCKIKKVLILLGEISMSKELELKKNLEIYYPNTQFVLEYNYLNNIKIIKNNYSFIIDKSKILLEESEIFHRIEKLINIEIIKHTLQII